VLFAGSNPVLAGLSLLLVVLARRHGASPALIGVMLGVFARAACSARCCRRGWRRDCRARWY
jgi:hypothetical protein